ncbi:MAG: ATP synthase F1 subunit delta [Candidatus Wallbacteria bacterium]|nr:ATP synthase F1 subunit delta [Candidatus Wallbacteria bacterium]
MIGSGLSHRYTRALFGAAVSTDTVDPVGDDLAVVADVLKQSPDLVLFLGHPQVSHDHKAQLVQKAFSGRLHELTLRFILLVLQKGRQEVLPRLRDEYARLVHLHRNQIVAQVRTAIALAANERKFINEALAKLTGKNVILEEGLEPSLLGGMIIRYGDKQIDGSVRHHLEQLRIELKAARVVFD